MDRTAVGYFRDRAAADRAYEGLVRGGFDRDDISVLGQGAEGKTGLADTSEDVSAGQGALTGGIFGLLLGAAAMLIPGIGPVVAIGPLAAALTGAITGGVTGAVVGGITAGLVHLGVPEDEARYYDERIRQGGYLVTVRTDDAHYAEARRMLEAQGAETHGEKVQAAGRATMPSTTADTATARGEQRGELRVGKQTVQETEHVSDTVRKEVAHVERTGDVNVRGNVSAAGTAGSDWATAMPTYRSTWERRHGTSGERWEAYEPVYRYGWE